MNCRAPGFPVHHHLPELAQTHFCWVSNAIQPSHPLRCPLLICLQFFSVSGSFPWVSSSHQVAKRLGIQLQPPSFQWTFRVDILWDWLIWSPCNPRDSQESSSADVCDLLLSWGFPVHPPWDYKPAHWVFLCQTLGSPQGRENGNNVLLWCGRKCGAGHRESVSEGLSGWMGPVVTDTLVYPCMWAQDSLWEGFLSGFSKGHGGTSLLAPGSAVLLRVSSPSIPRVELCISHPDQWLTLLLFLLFFYEIDVPIDLRWVSQLISALL